MKLNQNQPGRVVIQKLLGLMCLSFVLVAAPGCGGDEADSTDGGGGSGTAAGTTSDGSTGDGPASPAEVTTKPELTTETEATPETDETTDPGVTTDPEVTTAAEGEPQPPVAEPGSAEASVHAALDDAIARLKKKDLRGYIENYFPTGQLPRLRRTPDGIEKLAERMASDANRLNGLISNLQRARKGTIALDESGATAIVSLPADPNQPSSLIPEPVLTDAPLSGYGSELGDVIGKALAALEEGESKAFVLNMFPASELRHPDADARLAKLAAKLAANPEMVEKMKADLALISELTPELEDGGKTAVFEIAGKEVPYGQRTIRLPDRTFKFQLVEDSWRLYDNSTAIRQQISEQSRPASPDPGNLPAEYVKLNRHEDKWRIGIIKTVKTIR